MNLSTERTFYSRDCFAKDWFERKENVQMAVECLFIDDKEWAVSFKKF